MKDLISIVTANVSTLDQLASGLIELFAQIKTKGHRQIGYVSGVITSDGPNHITRNVRILAQHTNDIRSKFLFPLFSSTDIFDDDLFAKINATGAQNEDFMIFWRQIIRSGHITDIFMTPRWEISNGAREEHQIAQELNLTIHYHPYY